MRPRRGSATPSTAASPTSSRSSSRCLCHLLSLPQIDIFHSCSCSWVADLCRDRSGDDAAGAAGVAQGTGGAWAGRARRRQRLHGQRGRAARVRLLVLQQQQWRRRLCGRSGSATMRVQQWRPRVHNRAAPVRLHAAVLVPRARAGGLGRRRRTAGDGLRGGGGVVVLRGGGERVEVVVGVPRLRGPAERCLRLPEPRLVRTENCY
jgi:hypothetical protein